MTHEMKALGRARGNQWLVSPEHVDMAQDGLSPRPVRLAAEPQALTLDLARTAILVIDMQNDFCSEGGRADQAGRDIAAGRPAVDALQRLLPALRHAQVPVVWVNWGNRADLMNMAPNQLHAFNRSGDGIGFGDPLPGKDSRVLEQGSWSAAVVDDLTQEPGDIKVDKYRISGFQHTQLDSILRNLEVRTLLFAGVNVDQCVMCTLQDASFLGYGCVLLSDCCATTSPAFCLQATLWNVQRCFGFVAESSALVAQLEGRDSG